jgi:hypothetical protein
MHMYFYSYNCLLVSILRIHGLVLDRCLSLHDIDHIINGWESARST